MLNTMNMPQNQVKEAKRFLDDKYSSPAKAVLVLGDLGWDKFVWGSVDRISPEAPVPVLRAEKEVQKPGLAANVAENLIEFSKRWNLPVLVSGVLGEDAPGQEMKEHFASLGSQFSSLLAFDKKRPTTFKTRYLASAHHQLLRVDQESQEVISKDIEEKLLSSLEKALPQTSLIVLQDYAKGLFPKNFFQKVVVKAHEHKLRVITDPNMRSAPENYRGVDLITPNVAEASALLQRNIGRGDDNNVAEEAAKEIKKNFGIKSVLLTRSAHGMTLLDENDAVTHYPAIARSVFDVTGAGDTVVAVLSAALARGASLNIACILAMAAASVVVGKVGTATASFEEIRAELERLDRT